MLGHEATDKEGGALRLKGKPEIVRGLISGLVAQSELTPLLDEIYGGSNDLLDKRRLRTGEKGGPETVEELIDVKSRRRRVLQAPCSHINSIEVEQIKGALFGDVYVANCLDCGVLGSLQTTREEAQNTLQRSGSQQQLGGYKPPALAHTDLDWR